MTHPAKLETCMADRRKFLGWMGGTSALAWLAPALSLVLRAAEAAMVQRDSGTGFAHLDEQAARDLEAIAEQIIPTDETPGAREAGVIWFIDAALGGFQHAWKPPVLQELQSINDALPAGRRFADLEWERQTDILRGRETTSGFAMLRFLTLAGMFALPSYGGNREKLGWMMLGFENRHVWQPPFGYYDAPETREKSS